MAKSEEELDVLVEDVQNAIDEGIEDTSEWTMEQALEYYQALHNHVSLRINATIADIARRDVAAEQ